MDKIVIAGDSKFLQAVMAHLRLIPCSISTVLLEGVHDAAHTFHDQMSAARRGDLVLVIQPDNARNSLTDINYLKYVGVGPQGQDYGRFASFGGVKKVVVFLYGAKYLESAILKSFAKLELASK